MTCQVASRVLCSEGPFVSVSLLCVPSFVFCTLYCSPSIWRVMGGACSAYGGEERRIQGFGGENLNGRDHLGDPGMDGRIILRWIFRKWDVGA